MPLDPYRSFRFYLEINKIIVAGVSDVTGLQLETETDKYEEGGLNSFVHIFPKSTKYQNIVLKRGITGLDDLWLWHQNVIKGIKDRRSGAIVLKDETGTDKWRWEFVEAFPVKWTGPDFKADTNTVAFESVELAHHGITGGPI
jgi:phage tail-like protein